MIEVKLQVNESYRVNGIKVLRVVLGLGLKKAKDLSDDIRSAQFGKTVRMTWAQFGRFTYEVVKAVDNCDAAPFYTSDHKAFDDDGVLDFTQYEGGVQA